MSSPKTFKLLRIITVLFFSIATHILIAQGFSLPQAQFLKDSVKIGEPIKFSLVFRHDSDMELLFPDSTFDYSPFEFVKKEFYPTYSDSIESLDSVVYTLSTFEMEQSLSLALPVFIFENGDTSKLYSEPASVVLNQVIQIITPQDSLKPNTNYKILNTKLNYPYLMIGFGILILIVAITFVFFRKKLLAQYYLYTMKLDHNKFVKRYSDLQYEYRESPSSALLEDILSLWKKYLEKLERVSYTTLTTKEIAAIVDIPQLTSSLQNFDRAIYGGYVLEDMTNSINYLFDIANLKYINRQKEVRNV
jgi:hypothetical protein